jgi:DNA-binding NarL/FixJ family response regulator
MMPAQALSGPVVRTSPPGPAGHAAHVADRATRDAVERRLAALGVSRVDLEDETQNILRELLEVRIPPATREECIILARHIARQRAVDYLRKRAWRAKDDGGPTDNADEHPSVHDGAHDRDPIDRARQLRLLRDQVASGDISRRQLSILAGVAEGLAQNEIARGIKLSPQTVRNELALARKTYRSAWAKIAGSAALLTVALLVFLRLRHRDSDVVGAPPPERPSVQPPREPTPKDRALDLRHRALHDCDVGRFRGCLKELDEARELDPEGDGAPALERARSRARAGVGSEGGDGG